MKCDNVSFTYRGPDSHGRTLAELLSDITINYTTRNGSVSADLGSVIRMLDDKAFPAPEKPADPAYQVQTEVPVIAVPQRLAWFLQSRNIPLDTPVTLTFVHEYEPPTDVRGTGC